MGRYEDLKEGVPHRLDEKCEFCGSSMTATIERDQAGEKWVHIRCDGCDFGGGSNWTDDMTPEMNILIAIQIATYLACNRRH